MSDLDPITPDEALELYLRSREPEVSEWTLYSHRSRLSHFVRWCDGEGDIQNLNNLAGRDLHRFKLWRREEGDLNKVTVKTQMDTLRVFVRWLESIDAVEPDLSEKVQSPDLDKGDNVRTEMLEADSAKNILDYLRRYHYASLDHIMIRLLWRCGMRIGGLRALDIGDYDSDSPALEVRHRPDTDTPVKNRDAGERWIAISEGTAQVLDDYIADRRYDVTDEHGRDPLLTTAQGRPHQSSIRRTVYNWTRPCMVGEECPHGRETKTCEATDDSRAYECPSTVSPHAIRRGAITHWLQSDTESKAVSDRMNVSERVIEKHYDERSEKDKMEQRREYLDNI